MSPIEISNIDMLSLISYRTIFKLHIKNAVITRDVIDNQTTQPYTGIYFHF